MGVVHVITLPLKDPACKGCMCLKCWYSIPDGSSDDCHKCDLCDMNHTPECSKFHPIDL